MANPTSRSVLDNLALTTAVRSMVMKAYGHTLNAQDIDNKVKEFLVELAAGYEDQESRTAIVVGGSCEARTWKEKVFDIVMALLAGCAGTEIANLVAHVASSIGRKYLGPRTVSHKRLREQDDVEDVKPRSWKKKARTGNNDSSILNVANESQAKRHYLRPGGQSVEALWSLSVPSGSVLSAASSSGNKSVNGEVVWEDYVCDESDSSYVPSTENSEDEDTHMTQEDLQDVSEYIKRRMKYEDLCDISGDLSSEEETEVDSDDKSETKMLWKDYPSEDENDSDDPDYVPPPWNFEDVLEVVTRPCGGGIYYDEMDDLLYINELIDRGPLSDAEISDSDSAGDSSHLRDSSTLFRSIGLYEVPQHLKKYTSLPPYLRTPVDRRSDGEPLIDLRKKDRHWYLSYAGQLRAQAELRKPIASMDACINRVLAKDPLPYAFDDDEWKGFEDPRRLPPSSST